MTETKFQITFKGRLVVRTSSSELNQHLDEMIDRLVDAHLDDVMDHLIDTEGTDSRLSDADLSAKLSTGETELSIVVAAATPEEAMAIGMGAIRSAIHASGGSTPGWEKHAPSARWALEDLRYEQRHLDLAA